MRSAEHRTNQPIGASSLLDFSATIIDITPGGKIYDLVKTKKKGNRYVDHAPLLSRGRESGSRNHIVRLSVENFNLLNYLSIYTCCHSSSVIALISEDLLGKFIDLHHLRMALSVTPNFLPI